VNTHLITTNEYFKVKMADFREIYIYTPSSVNTHLITTNEYFKIFYGF